MRYCSNPGLSRLAVGLLVLGIAITSQADAAPKKIGYYDSFWADWEGFDPEAYVMMKSMGQRFAKLQEAASIAKSSGDTNTLEKAARDKLSDEIVDWATDLNPAVKPIKAMSDLAMDGAQRWLDWSFRSKVNKMYVKYKAAYEKSGNIKQSVDAVSTWLDDNSETASLGMTEKELSVIRANRALLIATIVDNHRKMAPEKYAGKDITRELRGNRAEPQDASRRDTPNPKTPEPAAKPTSTTKPAEPPKPASTAKPAEPPKAADSYKPVTPASRQAVLDCMCSCNSTANQSMVGVRYEPSPVNASPDCANASKGACVNQGYGCWRHAPPTGGSCVDGCFSRHGLAPGSVRP